MDRRRVDDQRGAFSGETVNEVTAPLAKKQRQISSNNSVDDAICESQSGTGLRNTLHGDIFQLKLLMLFLFRGIHLKYNKFQLSTEMPGQGGKFDDLVFHYQNAPQGEYRYRYLQAKHKQSDDKKINESDLINETDGDYSLQKYFRSYRNDIDNRGQNVQDCTICTNIGFDEKLLGSDNFKLTLIKSVDEIFAIEQEPNFKEPARYRLNKTPFLEDLLYGSSELHHLAKKLLEYAGNQQKITLNVKIFKTYHIDLVQKNVIDRVSWKFHQDFIKNTNLSQNARQFRDIIYKMWSINKKCDTKFEDYLDALKFKCSEGFGKNKDPSDKELDDVVTEKQIDDFLDKLVFAVDMPDEVRLGIILTKEVGQHFQLRECDFQSSFILEKMLDWFKLKLGNQMTQENNLFEQTRQKMVALRATAFSIDFRSKYLPPFFRESFQYQEATITKKARELEKFLNSSEENQILKISTRSCRCTTLKILSALETLPRFQNLDDGYLMIKSNHLIKRKHMKEWVQGAMKENKSHEILVIIGDSPGQITGYQQELMPHDPTEKFRKKMIFICSQDFVDTDEFERDEFDCKLLSEETINKILSTEVTFQGNQVTIENLVVERNRLNEIIDSSSIEEILFHQRKVNIPSFDSHEFEKSLWIERCLLPISLDEHCLDQLTKELGYSKERLYENCKFHPETDHIEWLIKNENEKKEIWNKVKNLLKKNEPIKTTISHQPLPTIINQIPEEKLLDHQSTGIIITGVAGSGKSTILSRHYEYVKKENPNVWVIKINLKNHSKYLAEQKIPTGESGEASTSSAIDILINFPGVTSQSFFASSLLKNRLNNSGGIVLLLDGFDEINFECQKTVTGLIKAISKGKTKLDRLIITTRPHLTERLQDELLQFAFNLENFGKHHQVKYLIQYWQNNKATVGENEIAQKGENEIAQKGENEIAQKFAVSLIDRVSEALKDKERTFIGIPLQCRILADCFQSQLETYLSAEQNSLTYSVPEIGLNYNIAQLYRMLFQKKRDIFRQEKATGSNDLDLILKWALDEFLQTIDSYHLKLAIDTIFEEENVNLLWPVQQLSDRQYDEDRKEERMRRYALHFGLTSVDDTSNAQKLQFLHRTFAEYMVAEFLYKGFVSEENKHKDQIRDSDGPLRDFMIHHILVENEYEGIRVFLDSMLKDMVTTDKTWRDTIHKSINESKPNHLQRFAQHFSFSMFDYVSLGTGAEALLTSIANGNVGIFDLIVDCLGAMYERESVQEIVKKAITNKYAFLFFSYSVEIHYRVANFLSDAKDNVLKEMLKLMIEHFPFARAKSYSNFPREARKAYIAFLLDFMEKHQKHLQNLFDLEYLSYYIVESKGFFIFDEYYDDELRRFIKLLITNIYSQQWSYQYFEDNLDYGGVAMSSQNENWTNGNIEKILSILQDLKQDKLLKTMSRTVLTSNPTLYQRIYGPSRAISELGESDLKNDQSTILQLKWQFLESAVVGNEEDCEEMFRTLSTGNDWNWINDTGFIYTALRDAVKCCRIDMFTLIMRLVRQHFDRQSNNGQQALRHVLTLQDSDVRLDPLLQSFHSGTLNKMIQTEVTREEDWSELFSNVLLGTDSPTDMAKNFENGFSLLLRHVLIHFSQQQLLNFIRLITSKDHKMEVQGMRYSIWAITIAQATSAYDSECDHFLEFVAKRLNQEDVKSLLLHEEDNVIVLYQTALMKGDKNIVNKLCGTRYLSPENCDFILSDFSEKAPNIILNWFDGYAKEMQPYDERIITDLIHFFVDHATNEQLLQLVQIITSLVGTQETYWDYLFDHLSDATILKILTRVSKLNEGNENETEFIVEKKLLTIDDVRGPDSIIIRAAQLRGEEFIKAVCDSLSEKNQFEIENFIKIYAPQRIKKMFFSEELCDWFCKCKSDIRWNSLNFFLNYCNDDQISAQFVDVITTLRNVDEKRCSIWGRCIDELANASDNWVAVCPRAQECRKLETFLAYVKEKVGEDSVIKLLLHNEGEQSNEAIFIRIALLYTGILMNDSFDYTSRFIIHTNVLSQEKQIDLRSTPTTNQFIQEICDVNSTFWKKSVPDQWNRALHFYLDYSMDSNELKSKNFFHAITFKHSTPGQPKTSIWEYLFKSNSPEVNREFSHLLRHVSEKLGEGILKDLALKKDEEGRFVLGEVLKKHGYEYNVKNLCAYLSTETRNEVFEILLSDPDLNNRLNVEIGSRPFSENTNGELLMYFDLVKTVRQINGRNCSMWTNYVAKSGHNQTIEKFEQFLEMIFDKLGEQYFKELVLHHDGDGESVIGRAISQEENLKIDAMLSLLSATSQTEVIQKVYTTTGLIDGMLSSKGSNYWTTHYLKINSSNGTASNLPDGFDILALYFLDKFNLNELKHFVKLVTSLNKVEGITRSIWGDYIEKVCSNRGYAQMEEERKKISASSIDCLLKVVSDKLGATVAVQLLYHYDSNRVVIKYFALKDCQELVDIAYRHLEQHEKNGKIEFRPIDGRLKTEQPTVKKQTQQRGKTRGKTQKVNK